MNEEIIANIHTVQARVNTACKKSGRDKYC